MRHVTSLWLLLLLLVPGFAEAAACYVAFPCKSGTPTPTECRVKVGSVTTTTPPYKGPTSGKFFCVTGDLSTLSATTVVEALPATAFGPAPAATSLSVNPADCQVPAVLEAGQLLPALPQ